MATVAVFIALGGAGYAAINLPANSVKEKQIARGAVGASELDNNSVGPKDLANDQAPQQPELLDCDVGVPWSTAAGGTQVFYWMDKHQIVHIRGAVACPNDIAGAAIFSMPKAYRPDLGLVRFGQLGTAQSVAQVAVVNSGVDEALVVYDGGSETDTEDYVSLEGITYKGEGPIP